LESRDPILEVAGSASRQPEKVRPQTSAPTARDTLHRDLHHGLLQIHPTAPPPARLPAWIPAMEAYFRRADLNQDGRISGQEAVAFFQGANLPQQVLAQARAANPRSQFLQPVLGVISPAPRIGVSEKIFCDPRRYGCTPIRTRPASSASRSSSTHCASSRWRRVGVSSRPT
jgi:hypothetical protein